jgi:hypothetical protein
MAVAFPVVVIKSRRFIKLVYGTRRAVFRKTSGRRSQAERPAEIHRLAVVEQAHG